VRVILAVFKGPALKARTGKPLCGLVWASFCGTLNEKHFGDYWLSFLIGVIEAAAYPVLLELNELAVIGGWLALKTAGQFGGWEKSRATFHRFLLGTVLGHRLR